MIWEVIIWDPSGRAILGEPAEPPVTSWQLSNRDIGYSYVSMRPFIECVIFLLICFFLKNSIPVVRRVLYCTERLTRNVQTETLFFCSSRLSEPTYIADTSAAGQQHSWRCRKAPWAHHDYMLPSNRLRPATAGKLHTHAGEGRHTYCHETASSHCIVQVLLILSSATWLHID